MTTSTPKRNANDLFKILIFLLALCGVAAALSPDFASRKTIRIGDGSSLFTRSVTPLRNMIMNSFGEKRLPLAFLPTNDFFGDSHRNSWERLSLRWNMRSESEGETLLTKDHGGDGDCMFRAISASLKDAMSDDLILLSPVALREIIASFVVGYRAVPGSTPPKDWQSEDFLNRLQTLGGMETFEWDDFWSPSCILRGEKYVRSDGRMVSVQDNQGKAEAVYFELTQRAVHWGTDYDLSILGNCLNITFIVFCEGTGKLYIYDYHEPEKPPRRYVLLYHLNKGGFQHFQQAGLLISDKKELLPAFVVRSSFKPSELPHFLKKIWFEDTGHSL